MGPRGKILTSLLMIIAVVLAVWQLTSPALIPSVGDEIPLLNAILESWKLGLAGSLWLG